MFSQNEKEIKCTKQKQQQQQQKTLSATHVRKNTSAQYSFLDKFTY